MELILSLVMLAKSHSIKYVCIKLATYFNNKINEDNLIFNKPYYIL